MTRSISLLKTSCLKGKTKRTSITWLLIFALTLFFAIPSGAQRRGQEDFTISGSVFEKDSKVPLEFATVILKRGDSGRVYGGIADAKGRFEVEVPAGSYSIHVEFFSFQTIVTDGVIVESDLELPPFFLEEDQETLEEVEIVAERSSMEVRLDRKIFNVGSDLTVKGATASDVLDNVPSVTVDADGVVSLRGNENVRILINGKPSGLIGINDTEALRQFPADAIEKVEVITSPSARYDAEGTAGILNIILRKEKASGFNGIATLNLGYPEEYGLSTSLNYRVKKINFFTNLGYSNRDSPGNASNKTQYFSEDAAYAITDENRIYTRERESWNLNFGLEYNLSEKTSLTMSVLFRDSDQNQLSENVTDGFNEEGELVNTMLRIQDEDETDRVNQYSFNFFHRFDDEGHELNFDAQLQDNSETESSLITNEETFPQDMPMPSEIVISDEVQKRVLLQSDYVLPFRNNQQIELGFRYTGVDQETDFKFFNEGPDGDYTVNDSLTNIFFYDEKITALYAQYGNKFGASMSMLLGLRMEASDIDVRAVGKEIDSINDKYYINYFPTANLVYEFTENENVSLGYNSRIRRPRSRFINPFPSQSSRTNIFQGNPDLDPTISNGVDLGYYKRWQKISLSTSVYFSHSTDVFQFISEDTGQQTEDGIPIIRRTPINIGTEDRYGWEFSVTYNPIKNWRFQTNFNYYNASREGMYEGQDLSFVNASWFGRFSSKIVLPADVDWQTTVFVRGPREDAQNKRELMAMMNLAFSRDILKGNGTLGFNVNDLFNSRKRIQETTGDTFIQESEFQWRERQWRFSFVYRFNQNKKRQRSRDSFNGDDDGEFGS